MADLQSQAANQLRNIEQSTGKTVADFAALIRAAGHEKHGKMVSFLKSEHGLGHGNANLIAHTVRQQAAGGPAAPTDLLSAQYAGKKAHLRAIYDRLAEIAEGQGSDAKKVIQKTGVSFRRKKQFALVQAPSSKRVQLGLAVARLTASRRSSKVGWWVSLLRSSKLSAGRSGSARMRTRSSPWPFR